jgi:hypothetical protein
MKSHPDFHIIAGKPLAIERKNSHHPESLRAWYERYKDVLAEYAIHPADISNVDETGFRIGVGRAHKVIAENTSTKIYIADADIRTYITVVECIQVDGNIIPPMVIHQGTLFTERFFPLGLDNNVLSALSPTGYNKDELLMAWLHHYDRFTKNRCRGVYGFGSHLLYDFIKYC